MIDVWNERLHVSMKNSKNEELQIHQKISKHETEKE